MEWRVNKLYGAAEEGLFRVEIPILATNTATFHTLCEAVLTISAQVSVSAVAHGGKAEKELALA